MESAGRGKFTQAVTDHVLADKNLFEDLAVMDQKGYPDEFGRDLAGPSPSFDGFFFGGGFLFFDLLDQLFVDVGSFFATSGHSLAGSTFNNALVTVFVRLTSLFAQCALAPRRFRRFHTDTGAALATPVGVTSGVLGDSPDLRTPTQVTRATGLAQVFFFVVFVTEGADGRFGVAIEETKLARRKLDDDFVTIFALNEGSRPRTSNHLGTFAGGKFKVVERGTDGKMLQ